LGMEKGASEYKPGWIKTHHLFVSEGLPDMLDMAVATLEYCPGPGFFLTMTVFVGVMLDQAPSVVFWTNVSPFVGAEGGNMILYGVLTVGSTEIETLFEVPRSLNVFASTSPVGNISAMLGMESVPIWNVSAMDVRFDQVKPFV